MKSPKMFVAALGTESPFQESQKINSTAKKVVVDGSKTQRHTTTS